MDSATLLLSEKVSYMELPFKEKFSAVREISTAALPNIFTNIGTYLKDLISLYFIGHLNDPLLFAAFGFGLTWISAFGSSIMYGLSAGFCTLASQAFGACNYHKFGLLYQKSIVVSTIILVFLCIFIWFSGSVLSLIGLEEELASQIGKLLQYLLLDLFIGMLFSMTQFYLVAQNIFTIPAYILFISTSIHIVWCYLFINVFNFGLIGMALARTLTDGLSLTLILLYIRIKNPCPESWFPWSRECLEGLGAFAKDIISYGSSVYMEWIIFEVITIILGIIEDVIVLAAHSATLNFLYINGTISLGLTLSITVFVGNAVGEGSVRKAKNYACTGLIMAVIVLTILDFIMLILRDQIALFYTEEPNVRNVVIIMLTLYFFAMHADLTNNTLGYILRALGQDRFVLKGFIFSYYGVGISCALITAIFTDFGFYGVWLSLIAGFYVMVSLTLYRFFTLDWEREVNRICNEMKQKANGHMLLHEQEMEAY